MRPSLLQDCIAVAIKSYPPPAFTDEAAVATWVGTLASGLVPAVYDLVSTTTAGLQAEAPPMDSEIEAAYAACCETGGFSKIGDGTILAWLKTVNWQQLIQTVISFISIIPKTPAV